MSNTVDAIVQPKSFDGGINTIINEKIPQWINIDSVTHGFDLVATLFTIIFLVTCFIVVMASILKVGQWKKYAQGSALMSLLILVGLRATPFIFVAIPTFTQVDNWLGIISSVITQVIIFACVLGIMIAFAFKLGYQLIEHPEFRKNNRNILATSIIVMIVATILPIVII